MLKNRYVFIVLGMLLYSVASSAAQVSIGIGFPNVSIGINLPVYPDLVRIPGYPVYYAPRLRENFFFYDSMYWVYQDDNWYASSWYNGPWGLVDPGYVPLYVLRIPVRYYRQPPPYFRGWRSDAPPRWGDHWGRDWEQRRSGWDRWNRRAAPAPAPLPVYQRQYSGDRYPRQVERQQELQNRNYRYQPHDPVVRQHNQEQAVQKAPAERGSRLQDIQRSTPRQQEAPAAAPRSPSGQPGRVEVQGRERAIQSAPPQQEQGAPSERGSRQQNIQRLTPHPQEAPAVAPRIQPPQRGGVDVQRSAPAAPQQGRPEVQDHRSPPQGAARHEQQRQKPQGQDERQPGQDADPQQRGQGHEQGRGRDRNE